MRRTLMSSKFALAALLAGALMLITPSVTLAQHVSRLPLFND